MNKSITTITRVTLINGILFTLFFLFTRPIYDTQEDVYILYLLSGGFGNAPTELLHYNHIIHPYLGWLLKNLFLWNSSVNWYTLFLLAAHFTGCSIILYQLIKRIQKPVALLLYLLLFIVFECRMLLTINFSNASAIIGCSGLVFLLTAAVNKKPAIKPLIYGAGLLLLASLFRIHVLIPLTGISIPFLILQYYKRGLPALAITLFISAGLIFLFNQIHTAYYTKHITHWNQEEDYRQKMYAFYNSRHFYTPQPGEKWFTEISLINNGLPVDTTFLTGSKLTAMFNELKKREIQTTDSPDGKNWFWINNRLLFCCVLLLLTFPAYNRKRIIATAGSLLLLISGLAWLNFTQKLPPFLLIATLFHFGLLTVTCFPEQSDYRAIVKRVRLLLAVFILFWGLVRIYKVNRVNSADNHRFRLAWSAIAQNKDYLFINTADRFPLQKYYVFDVPKNRPLTNFLSGEHFMLHIYKPVFNRFTIPGLCALPLNNHVLFWGERVQGFEDFFTTHCGTPVRASPPLNEFAGGEVYRLSAITNR